jgi:hypothetical protein
MKPDTIKKQILEFLTGRELTAAGTICAIVSPICKCKHSVIERRLREMRVVGTLDRELVKLDGVKNKVCFYKIHKNPVFERNPQVNSLFRKIANNL